jgi:hypothetical protein
MAFVACGYYLDRAVRGKKSHKSYNRKNHIVFIVLKYCSNTCETCIEPNNLSSCLTCPNGILAFYNIKKIYNLKSRILH